MCFQSTNMSLSVCVSVSVSSVCASSFAPNLDLMTSCSWSIWQCACMLRTALVFLFRCDGRHVLTWYEYYCIGHQSSELVTSRAKFLWFSPSPWSDVNSWLSLTDSFSVSMYRKIACAHSYQVLCFSYGKTLSVMVDAAWLWMANSFSVFCCFFVTTNCK